MLPVPEVGLTFSQVALLVAVQLQEAPVWSETPLVAPLHSTSAERVPSAKVHGVAPCVIVTVVPARFSVPVLDDVDVFGATEKAIVCVPEPVDPAGAIHALDEVTDHPHPLEVDTVTELAPPLGENTLFAAVTA